MQPVKPRRSLRVLVVGVGRAAPLVPCEKPLSTYGHEVTTLLHTLLSDAAARAAEAG